MTNILVATFYHFTRFKDPGALREPILHQLSAHNLKGTVLLAPEGVNGTLAGSPVNIEFAVKILRTLPKCEQLEYKESYAKSMPFYRLKVRLKKEIITMGIPRVDPSTRVGTYVSPKDWNDIIADPGTIVIDARNDFEVEIGTFEGAVNPRTSSFSDLPKWLDKHRAELQNKKVAMFCTGGIRCEKATSYLKEKGFDNVFHLKGGILRYLESIPETESRWRGECFVFDSRVSVKHKLQLGEYELCYACRWPVSAAGRSSSKFIPGVSCDHCADQRTEKQRARYASRHVQIKLAEEQGKLHIGATYETTKNSQAFDA